MSGKIQVILMIGIIKLYKPQANERNKNEKTKSKNKF